jgi:Tfp pilus assembly protein PilZ
MALAVDIEMAPTGALQDKHKCITHNVSGEGLRIRCQGEAMMGATVMISFSLPDDPAKIEAVGVVVWSRIVHANIADIGIDFVQITQSDREKICRYIEAHLQEDNAA